MKNVLVALLAGAAIGAVAAPALAHEDDEAVGAYGQYFGGYQSFDALYRHDYDGIQHGLSDGSYTRREAQYFVRQLQDIRQRENFYRSRDGVLSPGEGTDIQRRLERLHDVMHEAHEDGHAAQDDWRGSGSGYGYGNRGYNGYGAGSAFGRR